MESEIRNVLDKVRIIRENLGYSQETMCEEMGITQ